MNRSCLVFLAMTLACLHACTNVVRVADDDDGAGGGATATTTTTIGVGASTTQGVGGSPTPTSTSGGGPGGRCLGCSDWLLERAAQPEELCGFVPPGTCEPNTSCELLALLSMCACGDGAGTLGQCEAACQRSCTGRGVDMDCEVCIQAGCAPELNDCLADFGSR
jgi:hypothetical protein